MRVMRKFPLWAWQITRAYGMTTRKSTATLEVETGDVLLMLEALKELRKKAVEKGAGEEHLDKLDHLIATLHYMLQRPVGMR